jgi:hypothetical protein
MGAHTMYIVIHESITSNRKYIIHYKPHHERVSQGHWTIEDENHHIRDIDENELFNLIDSWIESDAT